MLQNVVEYEDVSRLTALEALCAANPEIKPLGFPKLYKFLVIVSTGYLAAYILKGL